MNDDLGFSLDISRISFDETYLAEMGPATAAALDAMSALDGGAIANPDEGRMVGHYWLRTPEMAPTATITREVGAVRGAVSEFAAAVRSGDIRGANGPFLDLIHVGIGGSALGPQLLCQALAPAGGGTVHFLDNADPQGVHDVLGRLRGGLGRTLVSVVSKSGVTPTPIHVARELERAYCRAGLRFPAHAVATTMAGTELDERARAEDWLARFQLWDWVGGRTSVTSAVGLLPAAFLGVDVDAFLDGAAAMDRLSRRPRVGDNPAALLALMWYWAGSGRGARNMVVVPYSDRLVSFPRYVQQLVMESVGKRRDRRGRVVRQGLTVYGNKGSTDQHAYFQQLRDGPDDFFVVFVRTGSRCGGPAPTDDQVCLGDHLFASSEATRDALYALGRESVTITLADLAARSVGGLIALFERATGIYAELVDVNAYHQPGVDKYVAGSTVELQRSVVSYLGDGGGPCTAEQVAAAVGCPERVETVYKVLEHLAAAPGRGIARMPVRDADPATVLFQADRPGPDKPRTDGGHG
jgi:glucose-6-phosphate isomerase